jgi:CheY-like chemotaxis protein
MNALIVTNEAALAALFQDVGAELGIESHATRKADEMPKRLEQGQYQAVILDFDTVSNARQSLATVRESRSNKGAVVFAVSTESGERKKLLREGANFLLRRPLDTIAVRRSLYAAYDMMLGEHRRYFRCTANLEILLTLGSGQSVPCTSINVSQGGVAVQTPQPLAPGESLYVALKLPDNFVVRGTGIVIWDDKHGKSGLSIQYSGPTMQRRLQAWLDSRLAEIAKKK